MHLELSEQAESTLREELADECRRREEAEREREELRSELVALREARETPESPGPTVVAPPPQTLTWPQRARSPKKRRSPGPPGGADGLADRR